MLDAELVKKYLDHLKTRGKDAKFVGSVHYHIRFFRGCLGLVKSSFAKLTSDQVQECLKLRKYQGYRDLRSSLHVLRGLMRYAVRQEVISGDPTEGISCQWLDVPGGFQSYQGVLRKILRRPAEILKYQLPLFAPHWEKYLQHLLDHGYSASRIYHVLVAGAEFHNFLVGRRLQRLSEITPGLLNAFLREKKDRVKTGPQRLQSVRAIIDGFMIYAFQELGQHFHKPPPKEKEMLAGKQLRQFLDFCRVHKGLAEITQAITRREIMRLLAFLERRGLDDIREVTPVDIDAYILRRARSVHAHSLGRVTGNLRSFFRYLHLTGTLSFDIARDIVSPCRFSADRRPKYIPWHRVQELLASIDRDDLSGKRDYAILTLLASHGLRPCEVAKLRGSDIDWENNSFLLRERKNGTSVRLPLAPQAEQALREYLAVRPAHNFPEIFLTVQAPIRPLKPDAMGQVAWNRLHASLGDSLPLYGPYLLRHSFAKALLDRGAKLPEIGALLGHRSLQSTLVYTRIATEELREVGDNYASLL